MSYGTINRHERATSVFSADKPQAWDSKLLRYAATIYLGKRQTASMEVLVHPKRVLSQQAVLLKYAVIPQK
jgi:hypothetical protein